MISTDNATVQFNGATGVQADGTEWHVNRFGTRVLVYGENIGTVTTEYATEALATVGALRMVDMFAAVPVGTLPDVRAFRLVKLPVSLTEGMRMAMRCNHWVYELCLSGTWRVTAA